MSSYPTTNSSLVDLPSINEVYRLAYSPERYGKRPLWASPSDHLFFRARLRLMPHRPFFYENSALLDDSSDDETSGCSSGSRGHDGALERLTKMPVDILYEIFSHLHPTDVLNLSRTTKRLRKILYEQHARWVWRSALASVRALPSCPTDMTEPQYASLAFDDWCHFCLAPEVEEIAWVCRVRCCHKCIKKQFISEDELDLYIPENVCIEKPDSIFPFILLPQKRVAGRNKPLYFLPRAREYLEELEEVESLMDDKALARWSYEKKEIQTARVEHANKCEYWNIHWAYRRSSKPTPSYMWEIAIVVWLTMLLTGLWKEKFLDIVRRL